MHVQSLWRYPVKSLGGESLEIAELTPDGVAGDRIVHVAGADGLLTGRTRHGLLTVPVSTSADGVPLVDGAPWTSEHAGDIVRERGGPDARLVEYRGPERFDIGNLLVATDGAVAAFGHDVRRLRPNILIGGVGPDVEATWPGHAIRIGDALIGVHSARQRCVVTSIDPDTGERNSGIHRMIMREFGGELALNCWVIESGRIAVGDPVGIETSSAHPRHLGGWIVGAPYRRVA